MTILHFSMQGVLMILLITLMVGVIRFHFSVQEEAILENTNAKCHLCTLKSTCRPLCNIGIHLMTLIIEHTHAKILVSELDSQMSWGDTNSDVVDY